MKLKKCRGANNSLFIEKKRYLKNSAQLLLSFAHPSMTTAMGFLNTFIK